MKRILLLFGYWLFSTLGAAQEKPKLFKDSIDGAFDISHYLHDLNGLLPVVAPITEPAIGYGAAVALLYFIPKEKSEFKKFQMPDIVLGAGGYTQNGTWFVGGGYIGFWNEDRVRYRGIGGYADVKLKYYGSGNSILEEDPAKFNLSSSILIQQAIIRIKKSNFFVGGKYQYSKTNVLAFEDSKLPWVDPLDFDLSASGVGLITEYENLDNVFSPTKGSRIQLSYDQNLEVIGSDRNFGKLTFFTYNYFPVNEKWIPAFRVESILATGDAPFYALPFVSLRGVPAMRYQGQLTLLGETEHMFNITPRWGVIGFAGVGRAFNTLEEMDPGPLAWNVGTGFRYMIARMMGLKMGLDVARGPEDWAVYVVFGTSWMK